MTRDHTICTEPDPTEDDTHLPDPTPEDVAAREETFGGLLQGQSDLNPRFREIMGEIFDGLKPRG